METQPAPPLHTVGIQIVVQLYKYKTKEAGAISALISKEYFMLFYHFQAPHTVHFLICKKWNGDLLNN